MDNYIIRIYRRDKDDPAKIAGVVEVVARQETKQFTSLVELNSILLRTRREGRNKRKREILEGE